MSKLNLWYARKLTADDEFQVTATFLNDNPQNRE